MCELIILSRREFCYVTNTLFVKWWTTIKSDGPVLKIEFGPPHADFGFIWSPPKRVNFDNKRQVDILWQCQFDTLSFPVRIKFCRPLHCLAISTLWFPQLSKLISFLVDQLFGPPQTCFGPPHMCAVCVDFKDRDVHFYDEHKRYHHHAVVTSCTGGLCFKYWTW